ncbi:hypothetical protein M9980_05260 [Sphingomonas donggukensis]|uniref:Secreted protein n=1 Tax=Sphingomonas donggukensis TaxID=2949093 RepID=A0ABY4TY92_9SPHN|nr:hypothetical protein [Sphingomonas donggukensis]URW76621.1 hypothetical protein M9980_05260 [Sphingomonas donggukensis]
MTFKSLIAATTLIAGTLAATAAQAAQCVPQREAEALVLNLGSTLVGSTAATCSPTLPANAYLRRSVAPLTAKFAATSDAAWPLAREALRKIAGPDVSPMLDSELARPMVTAMVAPMLAQQINAQDCPAIDRVLALLDPLPARNTAALIVTIVEIAGRNRKAARPPFTLCPPGTPS